jgi:ribonuclease HI
MGTGGFVVFGHEEHCLVAKASYYGELWNTNNRAELHALLQLMEWLEHNQSRLSNAPAIVIYGDSQLIINFCNRRARPSVSDLYTDM